MECCSLKRPLRYCISKAQKGRMREARLPGKDFFLLPWLRRWTVCPGTRVAFQAGAWRTPVGSRQLYTALKRHQERL